MKLLFKLNWSRLQKHHFKNFEKNEIRTHFIDLTNQDFNRINYFPFYYLNKQSKLLTFCFSITLEFNNFTMELLLWLSFRQILILKAARLESLKQICFRSKEVSSSWENENAPRAVSFSSLEEASSIVWKKLFIERVFKVDAITGKIK